MQTEIDDGKFIEAIELMGAACPWDTVKLELVRRPEGNLRFTGSVDSNPECGLEFDCVWASSLEEVIAWAQKIGPKRDPAIFRKQKIEELKAKLAKLQSVIVGIPPYRPGTRLGNGTPEVKRNVNEVIDVETANLA